MHVLLNSTEIPQNKIIASLEAYFLCKSCRFQRRLERMHKPINFAAFNS